jgi:hypothetical protein
MLKTPLKLRRLFSGGSKPPQNNKIGKKKLKYQNTQIFIEI